MLSIDSYGPLTFQGGGTAGGLKYKGSVAFENLPTTGQEEGDMYNITNDFTLGGKHYSAGTNVAWTGTEWDALGGDTASLFISAESHTTIEGYAVPVLTDTQIASAYNGIMAGKNVYIVDDLDYITIQVLDASSIDGIAIRLLFTDKLILTYKEDETIEAVKIPVIASGDNGNAQTLSSADLDYVYNTGFYFCNLCNHRPVNANGILIASKITDGTNFAFQMYNAFAENKSYIRFRNNNSWGNWKQIYTQGDISASDIMANNMQSVQANLERIDERIDDVIIQYESMPTASADYLNKIIQYIGTTTSSYTNGHFYKCISDGETPATYSWQEIPFATKDYVDNAIGNAIEGEY